MGQAEAPPHTPPAPEFPGMVMDPGVPAHRAGSVWGRGAVPQTLTASELTKSAGDTQNCLFKPQDSMLSHRRWGGPLAINLGEKDTYSK